MAESEATDVPQEAIAKEESKVTPADDNTGPGPDLETKSEAETKPEAENAEQGGAEAAVETSTKEEKLSKSVSVNEDNEIVKSGSVSKKKRRLTWRQKKTSTSVSDDKDDRPEIRPRTKSSSSDPKVGVDLALGKGRLQDLPPRTVVEVFKSTVERIPDTEALRYQESSDAEWQAISYSQYYDLVVQAAKSFIKLGVEQFNSVCIIGFNSTEWVIANLGALFAGALPGGIYTTNNAEACQFVAHDCKANVIVVENKTQLDKIMEVKSRLPNLKAIVQYKGEVPADVPDLYNWKQFMELGSDIPTEAVDKITGAMKPEQCALLIYTSGTTGNPKGVMLSHDNLTWTANCILETCQNMEFGNEHLVSYLPLSHQAAQMIDLYVTITIGGTLHFAQPDALKGTLGDTLRAAQPTLFFGVPRVYEKIMEKMQTKLAELTGMKKKVIKWGSKMGIKGNYRRQNSSQSLPVMWPVAEKLVFSKIRELVGFQRAKMLAIGSAPTRQEVHEFFMSFDMPLMELYGMSESSGPQTFNVSSCKGKWKTGSCGPLVPGAHQKIHEPDENGEGEICFYGRHVFMGYLNNEEKTKEAIDEEGWLHSGDIGKMDEDGFLFITGRIKELIITSGGENIPPVPIENRIKTEVPFLSNVFVVGDHRKYLTCLVTLLCNIDPDTAEPLDELTPVAIEALTEIGCECTKVSEVLETKNSAVFEAIEEGIKRANNDAISNAQKVQKFEVLAKDFSIPGGELGPTLKVRRPKVMAKYENEINSMYQ